MLVPRRHPGKDAIPPVPRFDPRAEMAALKRGHDGVLVALTLVAAVVLSSLWLPALALA
ncbi:MAG TPA: hypothetical protein VGN97_07695 [Mesorhizobium sp.]|nr:hypothetical protein [Mesorhizobium sp.]